VETGGAFEPDIVGPETRFGKAYGLAQFMENTGPWIANKADLPYEKELLYNPYYSIELDSIVAIQPFNKGLLTRISHTYYPYFNIYNTGKPEFGEFNNSLAWNGKPIVWYAKPIVKDGKTIGHVWANVKTDDVYDQALRSLTFVLIAWLFLIVIIVGISYSNYKRLQNKLNMFAKDFIADESIQTNLLPELSPIFSAFRDYTKELITKNIELFNEVEQRKKFENELQTVKERLLFLLSNSPSIFFSSKCAGDFGATFVSENVKQFLDMNHPNLLIFLIFLSIEFTPMIKKFY